MGQKPLGEKCFFLLQNCNCDNFKTLAVVSNTSSEEVWWRSNGIFRYCNDNNIPFITNSSKNEVLIKDFISKLRINTIISVQHKWIISSEIIDRVGGEAFNLHKAPLPKYKGFNTFTHAILNGEKEYASTIHKMISQVDTGNIVMQEFFDISPEETALSLFTKAQNYAYKLFRAFIQKLISNDPIITSEMVGNGFFYSKNAINAHREILDISNDDELCKKIRAFFFPPFEPAYFISRGNKVYLVPQNPFCAYEK